MAIFADTCCSSPEGPRTIDDGDDYAVLLSIRNGLPVQGTHVHNKRREVYALAAAEATDSDELLNGSWRRWLVDKARRDSGALRFAKVNVHV